MRAEKIKINHLGFTLTAARSLALTKGAVSSRWFCNGTSVSSEIVSQLSITEGRCRE